MAKITKNGQLDQHDRQILEILAADGRMAITDLAKELGMSKTPCSVRLKRLVNDGFIIIARIRSAD